MMDKPEEKEEKNIFTKYWPQLTAGAVLIFYIGFNFNVLESTAVKIFGMEKEHESDVTILNDEDDGVRSDFVRADECNREVARLENEILYWKLKYEYEKGSN